MSWIVRFCCVCLIVVSLSACEVNDIGNPCKLTQEQNVNNLKDLDTKARIVEASAACDLLSYCFANFYVEENNTQPDNKLGYCSNYCTPDQNQCPKGFTCAVFVKVQTLPASHKDILAPLVNKTICIKEPPTAEK